VFRFIEGIKEIPLSEDVSSDYYRLCSEFSNDRGISFGVFSKATHRGLGGQISSKLICDEAFTLILSQMKKELFGFELLRETVKGVNARILELGYKLTAKGRMQGDLLLFLLTPDAGNNGLLLEAAKVGMCGGVIFRGKKAFSLFSPQIAKDYVRLGSGESVPAELVSVVLSGSDVAVLGSRVSPQQEKWVLSAPLALRSRVEGELLAIGV
jgi:hypothetical protein